MGKKSKEAAANELLAGIKESKAKRAAMLRRFGIIPESILRGISRGDLSARMYQFQDENPARRIGMHQTVHTTEKSDIRRKIKTFGGTLKLGQKGGVQGTSGLSIMPAEFVAFFVKYYAKPGDVYVDPFMGQGIRMQVAKLFGLHYYGYDLSTEFFEYITAVRDRIDDGETTLSITHGDSKTPDAIPDGIGDFSFTSPPYWDVEYYGDEPEQLGTGKTYDEFLDGMETVARAWLPKFKPGAYNVINVNDFRRDKRFYPYHADTIALFCRAGWEITDTWIVDGLVGGLARTFAVDKNLGRIAPKVHEYAIIFRKPG